jgi:uncharacterized protein (DUF433 family)
MNRLYEVEQLLFDLTKSEKAVILQWVVSDLSGTYPGIEITSNVCGGEPCIIRTRIPVWLLVQARNLGMKEVELLNSYPTIRAEDLSNAWNYYRANKEEIEQQIRENEEA